MCGEETIVTVLILELAEYQLSVYLFYDSMLRSFIELERCKQSNDATEQQCTLSNIL